MGNINESLKTYSIPTPKMLIKYHNKPNKNGYFTISLVIPATKLLDNLAKLGYLGLKLILDNHLVNYLKHDIIKASSLSGYT